MRDAVEKRLEALVEHEDYLGIGNLMLEVLLRPGQQETPDNASKFIAECARKLVACAFGLPEFISYGCPYRDKHITHSDLGSWERDVFIQTIVFAYTIGATRENLPPPHDKLVQYYRATAEKQHVEIMRASEEYQKRRKPTDHIYTPDDL